MSKKILIDASNANETRIAVTENGKLDDFEIESNKKNAVKGDVYLAKITRVEPSLQAAFVDFGANRNGFLPLTEIHPDYFKIPTADEEKLKDVKSRFDDSRRITIKITAFDFARIIKVIKTIDANLLSIAIQSGKGTLSVANGTNSWDRSERTYFNLQFDAPPNIELLTHIKAESIEKLPVGDYEISISDKFLAKFDCMKNKTPTQTDLFMNSLPFTTDATIEYLIAVENEFLFSEYGKNNKVLKSSETRN